MTDFEFPRGDTLHALRRFAAVYGYQCDVHGVAPHPTVTQQVCQAAQRATQQTTETPNKTDTPFPIGKARAEECLDLRLDGMHFGLGGFRALVPALTLLPLRSLSLRDCYLGDEGLRQLCTGLLTGGSMEAVWDGQRYTTFSGTGDTLHTVNGPASPGECVSTSTATRVLPLCCLDLRGTHLRDASPLAPLLLACPRLRRLDLSYNQLGVCSGPFAVFCAAARVHPSLSELLLAHNALPCSTRDGGEGTTTMGALAELIVACGRPGSQLRRLDLRGNLLDVGVSSASLCWSAQTTHNTVHAYNAPRVFTKQEALSKSKHCGVCRQRLCVCEDTQIRRGCGPCALLGTHPLLDALFLNNTITELQVSDNGLPTIVLEWIEAKLRVNRRHATPIAVAFADPSHGKLCCYPSHSTQPVLAWRTIDTVLERAKGNALSHVLAGPEAVRDSERAVGAAGAVREAQSSPPAHTPSPPHAAEPEANANDGDSEEPHQTSPLPPLPPLLTTYASSPDTVPAREQVWTSTEVEKLLVETFQSIRATVASCVVSAREGEEAAGG